MSIENQKIEELEKKIEKLKPEILNLLADIEDISEFSHEIQLRVNFYKDALNGKNLIDQKIATLKDYLLKLKNAEREAGLLTEELAGAYKKLIGSGSGFAIAVLNSFLNGSLPQNEDMLPLINHFNRIKTLQSEITDLKLQSLDKKFLEISKIKSKELWVQGKLKLLEIQQTSVYKAFEKKVVDDAKEDSMKAEETQQYIDAIKAHRTSHEKIKSLLQNKMIAKKDLLVEVNKFVKNEKIETSDELNSCINKIHTNLNSIKVDIKEKEDNLYNVVLEFKDYKGNVDRIHKIIQYKKDIEIIEKIQKEKDEIKFEASKLLTEEQKNYGWQSFASLVLGIVGMIAWLFSPLFLCAPITIVGLVFGIKGMKSNRRAIAIAGVVLCIIGLLLTIMIVLFGDYSDFMSDSSSKNITDSEKVSSAEESTQTEEFEQPAANIEVTDTQKVEHIDQNQTYTLSASQLYDEYDSNEVSADMKYKGKIVIVSGTFLNVNKDFMGYASMSIYESRTWFGDGEYGGSMPSGGSVVCRFAEDEQSPIASLSKGQEITVKGHVSGKFFLSVILDEAVLQ